MKKLMIGLASVLTSALCGAYTLRADTIDDLRRAARAQNARYQFLKRTQTRVTPGRTNLVARLMRQSIGERLSEARAGWTNALIRAQDNWTFYTNTAARVDAVADTLRAKRAEYVEKRDASVLPTTKAIYQAFIDQIDEWLARLEARKEDY